MPPLTHEIEEHIPVDSSGRQAQGGGQTLFWSQAADNILAELARLRALSRERRSETNARDFPSPEAVASVVRLLSHALFPRRLGRFRGTETGETHFVASSLNDALNLLGKEIQAELNYWQAESPHPFDAGQAA